MTLLDGRPGAEYRLESLRDNSTVLGDLGVYEGALVKIRSVLPFWGPLIVDLGGWQVALDRSVAGAISVRIVQDH